MQIDLADPDVLAYLKEIRSETADLGGAIAYDPLSELLRKGALPQSPEAALDNLYEKVQAGIKTAPKMQRIAIDATLYETAGASATVEYR